MGLLRSSAMDRSEPSLVPEWLKGTTGHNHSFQGGLTRSSTFGSRVHHSPFVAGAFGERVVERESNHGRSYPNFGRGGRFERSERDREVPVIGRGHDWEWSRERRTYDGERFVGDGRFKGGHGGYHRSLPSGRPEAERLGNLVENFDKKFSSGWSGNGVERSSGFDRKLTIRTPASVRTSNLVTKKLPDSLDGSNHTEIEPVVEPPSPSPSPSAHVPKMSEALIHLSSQPQQQAALETQRLEELALKQSRQLVPMKPALPKTMGSSRDKFKQIKPVTGLEPKVNPPVAPYRPPPPSNGTKQLVVLKSKNVVASTPAASSGPLANRGATTPKQASGKHEDRKPLVLSQNRSDFFNAIRKKAAANGENRNPQEHENENTRTGDGVESTTSVKDVCRPVNDLKAAEHELKPQFTPASVFCGSEEEEMIFLKSLGWVESPEGEDEALTTEEIDSFFQKHPSALNQMLRNLSGSSLGSSSSSGSDSDDESRVRSA